ncbi:MAG: FAD-dependent oxidoreductase [Christensenellaceae bacterium]|nr:FAD-dependent oxidoreductase [Christensenellaceae bacterium]
MIKAMEFSETATNEIQKCLGCLKPFCDGCPAKTHIRDAIKLIKEGRELEAGAMLFRNNPLSAVCGAVCPAYKFCNPTCIRFNRGMGVDFNAIENEVSKKFLDSDFKFEREVNANPKRFLIIGAGAVGLSLSFYLSVAGHSATVIDNNEKVGGMMRYGIPDCRLDKTLFDKIQAKLESVGVKFEMKTTADLVNIEKYLDKFDKVIVSTGAWESKKLGISGEERDNVFGAIEFLAAAHNALPKFADGEVVAVIGGGDTAIDCALTVKVANPKSRAIIVYYKDANSLKCAPRERQMAKTMGVEFKFDSSTKKIDERGLVFENGETLNCDKIVVAIGQNKPQFKTENPNIFFAGDCKNGTQTIVECVAQAQEIFNLLSDNKN